MKYVTLPTQQLYLYIKYYYNITITIILARFPLSSEALRPRGGTLWIFGWDVSLEPWTLNS